LLFALGEPVAFVALVVAFLLGLLIRALAIRLTARTLRLAERRDPVAPRLREDVDPFGAVAAAVGGMGWGKPISVDEVPRTHGRGRAAAVFAAGPLACILVSQLLFAAYVVLFPDNLLPVLNMSNVLRGFTLPFGEQVLLSLAVGLLAFGLLALLPMPPLDGFGILWSALRRPGAGAQRMRLWLEDKNLGVLILLVCCFFPLNYPLLLVILDVLGVLFLRLWGGPQPL
jgi:Zn-dependent protease